jgi:hypothetical protein
MSQGSSPSSTTPKKKNKKMTTNQGGSSSSVFCSFTSCINTQKTPISINGVVPFGQEPIQMLYTSLPLSSLPLHLLGGVDIPMYKKLHQVVMKSVRFQRDYKNLGDALGGDAISEITKT